MRAVHGTVRTTHRALNSFTEQEGLEPELKRGINAGSRRLAKKAAVNARKRRKEAISALKQGEVNTIRVARQGIKNAAPAAAELKNADMALKATKRSPAAKQLIRRAQQRKWQASKSVVRAYGKTVAAVVRAVRHSSTLIWSAAGILLLALLAVGLISTAVMLNSGMAEETDIEYVEPASAIYYFLRTKLDLPPAAATGVLSNIDSESGFDVNALGDNGTSYGLCQWHNERWDRLIEFCMDNGYNPQTIAGQLHYLKWELETRYPALLEDLREMDNDVGGCYDAAATWCRVYERPDQVELRAAKRGESAVMSFWPAYGFRDEQWSKQGMALALTAYMELGNDGGYKYWSWWGYAERVEWCCIFVSWCADQNGYLEAGIMPRQQGVAHWATGYPWYYSHGETITATPDVIPQPGWVAFFGRGHTGIVYACDGVNAYLVEGNNMDAVRLKSYPLDDVHNFLWWCVPPYTE